MAGPKVSSVAREKRLYTPAMQARRFVFLKLHQAWTLLTNRIYHVRYFISRIDTLCRSVSDAVDVACSP